MRSFAMLLCGALAAAAAGSPAEAQPPAARSTAQPAIAPVDPATIEMPELSFPPSPDAANDFDKYFYFNRAGTDFDTAYADILECDGYARGISYRVEGVPSYALAQYGLGGAIGGAIGNAVADAIFGSQQRRQQRRNIMRTCMGYKGYKAYGLPRDLWVKFNFEEGLSTVEEGRRLHLLQVQAKVASGPAPHAGEMDQ
jgi:hypothetical protein